MEPANDSTATKTPSDRGLDVDNGSRERYSSPLPLTWAFMGPNGLRAGWLILFAGCLFYALRFIFGTIFYSAGLVDENSGQTAVSTIFLELISFLSMLGVGAAVAAIEHRSPLSYNLNGPRRVAGFFLGAVSGLSLIHI